MNKKLTDILESIKKNNFTTVKELIDHSMFYKLDWEKTINEYISLIKEYLVSDNKEDILEG